MQALRPRPALAMPHVRGLAAPGAYGLRGNRARRLVRPGSISPAWTFARAQVNTRATVLGPDDATWSEVAANVPRFWGSARRLRIEGQRSNAVINPCFEGGAPGTPGTLPSNVNTYNPGGLTRQIVGFGTLADGRRYFDCRFFGTSSIDAECTLYFVGNLAATTGTTVTGSLDATVIAGSTAGLAGAPKLRLFEVNSSLSYLREGSVAINTAGVLTRATHTRTLGASASYANLCFSIDPRAGQAVDITVRLVLPQIEVGAFASSPILPPDGSPQASTRGADLMSVTLSRLGIGGTGACTLLWSGLIPEALQYPCLLDVSDGTLSNRAWVFRSGSGLVVSRSTAGVVVAGNISGTFSSATMARVGMVLDGAGRVAACLNGGTVAAVTGAPTSGLTTLRLGSGPGGDQPLFGEVAYLDVLPGAVPNDVLQALTLRTPLA